MLDPKQTTIDQPPLIDRIFKKILYVLLAIFVAGMGFMFFDKKVVAKDDIEKKLIQWQTEYDQTLSNEELAKQATCLKTKEGAALKLLANATDQTKYSKSIGDIDELIWKRDVIQCGKSKALIPEAKALSFEHSESIAPAKTALRPIHQGGSEQQAYIDYAWSISHDPTFIYLLKAENGLIAPNTLSRTIGKNGYRDIGFCQINKGYHPEITNDKRFLTDTEWQLDKCLRLYKGGTKFYGIKKINSVKKYFTWI